MKWKLSVNLLVSMASQNNLFQLMQMDGSRQNQKNS